MSTTVQFKDRKDSVEFYESRYRRGYMNYWSSFEKGKLIDLVKSLDLPRSGDALDFGCGRGIFAEVLKEVLPAWNVYGCDISSEAVETARQNFPGITFFVLGDKNFHDSKFSFIYSHHVLEHTYDEKVTANEMVSFAADSCTMLHSLPCGNEGSFEYAIAKLVKNGIDPATGKFFFEDTGHVRRLTTKQAAELFKPSGFSLLKESYSNQYYGAIKWICESSFRFVLRFTDKSKAVDSAAAARLTRLRLKMVFVWFCFFAGPGLFNQDKGKYYLLKKLLQSVSAVLFFIVTIPVSAWCSYKARQEWETARENRNGSDMFLVFRR